MSELRKSYGRINTTKTKDLGHGIVECIVSTNALDRHGERLNIKGLNTKNYSGVVFVNHDYEMLPVGKSLGLRKTADGKLISKTQFAIDEWDFANTVYKLVKNGYMPDVSIGFIPKEFNAENDEWTKSEMIEYSHVGIGANPEAKVSKGLKHIGMDIDEFKAQVKTHISETKDLKGDAVVEEVEEALVDTTSEIEDVKTAENDPKNKGAVADVLAEQDKWEVMENFWNVIYAFADAFYDPEVKVTEFEALLAECVVILQTIVEGTYAYEEEGITATGVVGLQIGKADEWKLKLLKQLFDKDVDELDNVREHISSIKSVLSATEDELNQLATNDTDKTPEEQIKRKRITLVRAKKSVQIADRLSELTIVALNKKLNNK